ncbi:hypothetical protein LTR37_020257 [Vermiconidia calcicola]|uniref:Uncharacterized protein n=1 Tax=Vermiconidia calcicola TaxID=1690605 RepID=A0ACC3MBQ0_9PEZI|nr:hypothetical protein LTR37_020257 [Vermiconidia calcicola]
MSNATSTTSPTAPSQAQKLRSRRACSDPIGNDYARSGGSVEGVKGCAICHNKDSYGHGDSAIYFGGKKVAKRLGGGGGSKGDAEAK